MSLSFARKICSGETGVMTAVLRIISTKKLPERFLSPASDTDFPTIGELASISVSTKYSRQPSLKSSIASLCEGRILSEKSARYIPPTSTIGKPTQAKSNIFSELNPASTAIPFTTKFVLVPTNVMQPPKMAAYDRGISSFDGDILFFFDHE